MVHVRETISDYERRGVKVVGIAAQSYEKASEYFKTKSRGYPFAFLADEDRTVVRAYGVHVRANVESYNIARPANFIVDEAGIIRYVYVGRHQMDFPRDAEVLEAIEGLPSAG